MKRQLNIDAWPRKDHFDFFSQFEEPFFGVSVEVDCTKAYTAAKDRACSFFLYYLYKSLVAANFIEPFRYRIVEEKVWVYDQVNASPTITRPDGTFGYAYLNYEEDFNVFILNAQAEISRVQRGQGLVPALKGENVIHYSTLPWIRFTAISHARKLSIQDSIPKITFGKMTEKEGRKFMPVSIHVHHGLMDGYHVAQYLEQYQILLDQG